MPIYKLFSQPSTRPIDPDANNIYTRLKYYDAEGKTESHLSGRVICLPYKFENVFPLLLDGYVYKLEKGLKEIDICQKQEDLAQRPNWANCLPSLAEAEFVEFIKNIVKRKSINIHDQSKEYILNLALPLAVNLLCNNQESDGKLYLKCLENTLYDYYIEKFKLYGDFLNEFSYNSSRLRCHINTNSFEEFYKRSERILNSCDLRLNGFCIKENHDLKKFAEKMKLIVEYMDLFPIGGRNRIDLLLGEYTSKREMHITNFQRYFKNRDTDKIEVDLGLVFGKISDLKGIRSNQFDNTKLNSEMRSNIEFIEKTMLIDVFKTILNPESP